MEEAVRDTVRRIEESTRRSRGENDFLVFRKMTISELASCDSENAPDAIYVLLGERKSRSRKDAIRAQAEDDDSDKVPYASVAKTEFTEHAPTKRISYD